MLRWRVLTFCIMSPKKKKAKAEPQAVAPNADGGGFPTIDSNANQDFLQIVSAAVALIKARWPNIESWDPLPEAGDSHPTK